MCCCTQLEKQPIRTADARNLDKAPLRGKLQMFEIETLNTTRYEIVVCERKKRGLERALRPNPTKYGLGENVEIAQDHETRGLKLHRFASVTIRRSMLLANEHLIEWTAVRSSRVKELRSNRCHDIHEPMNWATAKEKTEKHH